MAAVWSWLRMRFVKARANDMVNGDGDDDISVRRFLLRALGLQNLCARGTCSRMFAVLTKIS